MSEATFRPARREECESLTGLVMRSKGHWGYSEEFLEACRSDLTITPEYLERYPTVVLDAEGTVSGLYSFMADREPVELDLLYVDPSAIGKGYGQLLWRHLLQTAREQGHERFLIHSDPHAESFYRKMGAVRVGEVESSVFPGRKLPLLQVTVD